MYTYKKKRKEYEYLLFYDDDEQIKKKNIEKYKKNRDLMSVSLIYDVMEAN